MCSGLPVVCSDWNGYRDSVVNGLSGYLIPTSVFGPVLQNSEADYLAYCDADTDYSAFLGSSSVIIDEPYATNKIVELVSNPSLLQRLLQMPVMLVSNSTGQSFSNNMNFT